MSRLVILCTGAMSAVDHRMRPALVFVSEFGYLQPQYYVSPRASCSEDKAICWLTDALQGNNRSLTRPRSCTEHIGHHAR